MLAHALEEAKPGDKILVVGFGQGCDALLFEVTPSIAQAGATRRGVTGHLARRKEETNYGSSCLQRPVDIERGMRAEADKAHAAVLAVAQPRAC